MCAPGASTCPSVRSADLHRRPCERPPSRWTSVWKLKITASPKPETCKIEAAEIGQVRIREKGSCLQVSLLTRGDVHACAPCALFSHRRGVAGNPLSRRGALCPGLWAPARLPLACSLVHDALRSFGCRLRWCGGRALCDSLESEPGGWDRGGAVCRPGINRKALQSDQVEFAAPSERIV